jgi:hypothetical protein
VVIVDEELLRMFRAPGRCELCGNWCDVREPHHVFARGLGGGARLDIPENLLALGSTPGWQCRCHRLCEDGFIPRHAQLCVVALREGMEVEEVEAEIHRVRRLPKRAA